MEILERRDALTRLRRLLRNWRPKPNTGFFAKDILFLLFIVFLQTTVLPQVLGPLGHLDLLTPWLVISFIRQRCLQASILAFVAAISLETKLAIPSGLYISAYWIMASILFQVRPALSWRYKTPWLVSYLIGAIWVILFESFVLHFFKTASYVQPYHIFQICLRIATSTLFGMYLAREWMTIDAEEPVPQ